MSVHNGARTLRTAVNSTLLALPKDAEFLILDNASEDATARILKTITDPRLKIFNSKSPLGPGDRLNYLLRQVRGEFVARMDSDDITLPWRFTAALHNLNKTGADFVFSNAVLFGRGLTKFPIRVQPPVRMNESQSLLALLYSNPFMHPSMVCRASSIETLQGYKNVPSDDLDLWLRAAQSGMKIIRLGGYGILYRVHDGQETKDPNWRKNSLEDYAAVSLRAELSARLRLEVGKGGDCDDLTLWKAFVFSSIGLTLNQVGILKCIRYLVTGKLAHKAPAQGLS